MSIKKRYEQQGCSYSEIHLKKSKRQKKFAAFTTVVTNRQLHFI